MHHFIYPSQDTFVTNTVGFQDLNFGLDEILRVGTQLAVTKGQTPVTLSTEWSTTSCSLWETWTTPWGYFYTSSFATTISTSVYINRALVQFDVSSISESISDGDISNPQFKLKMNVAREVQLPIQYNVYVFPISESWVMGNGYVSDNGSSQGASWDFRDSENGTPWATPGVSYIQSLSATQSFDYQVGDINIDVTPIVMSWISGTVQNNGFLIVSSDEFAATGSGMGLYFFSKDTNTIYEPVLDVAWNDFSFSTGSVSTGSINITTAQPGLDGLVVASASMSGPLYGGFSGIGNIMISCSIDPVSGSSNFVTNSYASGLLSLIGLNQLITSMSIVGNFSGSISQSIVMVDKKCKSCKPVFAGGFPVPDFDQSPPFFPAAGDDENFLVIDGQFPSMYYPAPNIPSFIQAGLWYLNPPTPPGGQNQTQYDGHDIYGWGHAFDEFNQYNWTSDHVYQNEFGSSSVNLECCWPRPVTMSLVMGTFIDGLFSGSTFTSSLFKKYILGYGYLVGSWSEGMIVGSEITSSYPFVPMFPNAIIVNFTGSYVNGNAFGSLTQVTQSISGSATFDGVFTSGPFVGSHIHAPFEGLLLTSSYSYTSSITPTSTSLSPVDVGRPFAAVVQNIPSTVKSGNLIKINVFGRPQFPLKNFNRQTQFTQFLTPQYLPTSSYYAIKDNETEQILLDFDNYTQISCDQNGNYFQLDTTSYPQERYFRILIRVEGSGSIYTFDNGNIFKIVR